MYKVLLVDDQSIIVEGLKCIIRDFNLGFDDFTIVHDGEEALKIIDRYLPDVIFTDIRMENVDGLQLTEEIRKKGIWGRDVPIILVSGYTEFEYARKGISHRVFDYVLKPINEQTIFNILVKVKQHIENRIRNTDDKRKIYDAGSGAFMKIFNKRIKDPEIITEMFNSANIKVIDQSSYYLARITKVDNAVISHNDIEKIVDILPGELIYSFGLGIGVILFIGLKDNIKEFNRLNFHSIVPLLKKERVRIYLSDLIDNISDLCDAYHRLELVTRFRKVISNRAIITYFDIMEFSEDGEDFSTEIDGIIKGIECADLTSVIKNLNEIYEYIFASKKLSITYFEKLYNNMCMQIFMKFKFLTGLEDFSRILEKFEKARDIVDESESLEGIHNSIKSIIIELYEYYTKSNIKMFGTNYIVEKAKQYIDNNFSDSNLTLTSTAETLQISATYLCTIFKKHIGISFSDYIKKVRIQQAVLILKTTDVNISDLGNMVGYTGEKSFFYAFRIETGISPAKYRRKLI